MSSGILYSAISIIVIAMIIYFGKNFEEYIAKLNDIKEKKFFKILVNVFLIIIAIIFLCLFVYNFKRLSKTINHYNFGVNNKILNEKYDQMLWNENKFYAEILKNNFENQNYSKPYIPENFSYVEGEWQSGFVIQDEKGNQYVWIPCSNQNIENVEKLGRKNFSKNAFVSKDICFHENYKDFLKSALDNGGFYISRYEIGNDNEIPVSKFGAKLWKNVTYDEAKKIISNMHNSENIKCEIINGYAYDTAVNWIIGDNEEFTTNRIDLEKEILSGRNSNKNIYDLFDNVMELTSETSYGNIVIRGCIGDGNNSDFKEYSYNLGFDENVLERFLIRDTDNYYTLDIPMTFRTVIYK